MSKLVSALAVVALFLVVGVGAHQAIAGQDAGPIAAAVTAAAPSVPTVTTAGDVSLDGILSALQGGKWLFAFGAVLVLAVKLLRPLAAKKWAWFNTSLGGKVMAFSVALLMSVGTAMASGQGFTLGLLGTALSLAWVAAGQNEHLKDTSSAAAPTPAVT